jgi:vitamin B12 transporter
LIGRQGEAYEEKIAFGGSAAVGLGAFEPGRALWAQGEEAAAAAVLDTVVVTASRGEESVREVTTNITVIDRQAIERAPADRLPTETGGLGSRVLILVDGRPALTGNVAAIIKTNIERIEIIKGPAAISYGSQTMGGVINIISKRGEGDLSARVQAGFGSYSFSNQEFGMDGRTGLFDYSFGVYHSETDDFKNGKGVLVKGTDNKWIYSGAIKVRPLGKFGYRQPDG